MNQSIKYLLYKNVLYKFKNFSVFVYKGDNSVSEEFEMKYETIHKYFKIINIIKAFQSFYLNFLLLIQCVTCHFCVNICEIY